MLRDNISWEAISDKLRTRISSGCCLKWSGELCRKRWNQMIRHIGHYKNKSFAEQVELLSQRYCPDLLEAREAYDAKVPVC
uniref:Myb-like domain-containing protein n=1 Tax=Vitis vinifera TaxID=29760 RepID=F6GU30_VITVI